MDTNEEEYQSKRRDADLNGLLIANRKLKVETEKLEQEEEDRKSRPRWMKVLARYWPAAVAFSVFAGPTLQYCWNHWIGEPLKIIEQEKDIVRTERQQLLIDRAQNADIERARSVGEANLAKNERAEALKDKEKYLLQAKEALVSLEGAQRAVEVAKATERLANANVKKAEDLAIAARDNAFKVQAQSDIVLTDSIFRQRQYFESEIIFRDEVKAAKSALKFDLANDPAATELELQSLQKTGGVKGVLAKAFLTIPITRSIVMASSPGFSEKYKIAKARIETLYDATAAGGVTVLKGSALGLIDLTLLGTGEKAIVFTDEQVYFTVNSIYQSMTIDEFSKATIRNFGFVRLFLNFGGEGEVGPIEFTVSEMSPEQFIQFHRSFSTQRSSE